MFCVGNNQGCTHTACERLKADLNLTGENTHIVVHVGKDGGGETTCNTKDHYGQYCCDIRTANLIEGPISEHASSVDVF